MIIKQILHMSKTYRLSKFVIGIFGVGLYHGAYIAEVIRSGIQAVPTGQKEAAFHRATRRIRQCSTLSFRRH